MFTNLGYPAASSLLGGIVSLLFPVTNPLPVTHAKVGYPIDGSTLGSGVLWTSDPGSKQVCKCKKCHHWIEGVLADLVLGDYASTMTEHSCIDSNIILNSST